MMMMDSPLACRSDVSPSLQVPVDPAKDSLSHPPKEGYITVYFQSKDQLFPILAAVNTGSSAMMVPEAMYVEYFTHIPLQPPNT